MNSGINCMQCGVAIFSASQFCNGCGSPVYARPMPITSDYRSKTTLSFILAAIGFFLCGPFTCIPGMIFPKQDLDAAREGRAPKSVESTAQIAFYLNLAAMIVYLLCNGLFLLRLMA